MLDPAFPELRLDCWGISQGQLFNEQDLARDILLRKGFQDCAEEVVETWMACDAEDCGFQMLNDDEIMTSVQEEFIQVVRVHQMLTALETAMEWYEQQSECCPTQLLLLKRIRDIAAKKRMIQQKIRLFSTIKVINPSKIWFTLSSSVNWLGIEDLFSGVVFVHFDNVTCPFNSLHFDEVYSVRFFI
ncbi:uncharacterized protein TNCV_2938041 [Trichonephila clavipes]|nr:uncharacterized protein TNCV_2938041 [Trichonephila clavipes]